MRVVSNLLETRQRVLQPLLSDLDNLLNGLVELQARERALLQDVRYMDRYLRSREPWVRNGPRVTLADLPAALAGLAALPMPQLWSGGADGRCGGCGPSGRNARSGRPLPSSPPSRCSLPCGIVSAELPGQGAGATQRIRPVVVLGEGAAQRAWLAVNLCSRGMVAGRFTGCAGRIAGTGSRHTASRSGPVHGGLHAGALFQQRRRGQRQPGPCITGQSLQADRLVPGRAARGAGHESLAMACGRRWI